MNIAKLNDDVVILIYKFIYADVLCSIRNLKNLIYILSKARITNTLMVGTFNSHQMILNVNIVMSIIIQICREAKFKFEYLAIENL